MSLASRSRENVRRRLGGGGPGAALVLAAAATATSAPGAAPAPVDGLVSAFQAICKRSFGNLAQIKMQARHRGFAQEPLPLELPQGFYARRGEMALVYQGAPIPGHEAGVPVPQCHVEDIEQHPERFQDAAARVQAAFGLGPAEYSSSGDLRIAKWPWATEGHPRLLLILSFQRLAGEPKLLLTMMPDEK